MTIETAQKRLAALQGHLTGTVDLARERANATFDSRRMKWFFLGGKEFADAMDTAYQIVRRDPELYLGDGYLFDMPHTEQRERTMRQIRRYFEVRNSLKDALLVKALRDVMSYYSPSFAMRIYATETLFPGAFQMFGTKEQYDNIIDDIDKGRILGCFAMTELGHSSFLRGLETTATFDKKTDEFVIDSPSLLATKCWIGMAAQTATHAVAFCQVVIDGEKRGLNWILVPLHDPKTGRLVPGVTAGDMGVKYGRNGLDNGWIQFSRLRVPRTNMLMKWSQVSRDGVYQTSANPSIAYVSLIGERLDVLPGTAYTMGQMLTVACRYGCVRRQGQNSEQIMDFQTHYMNLMPGVASVYVIQVVHLRLWNRWEKATADTVSNPDKLLRILPDMHAISSGLKGVTSWWTCEVLERCRRSLGGHAYSAYNAIGEVISNWGVVTTGGGDNFVLMQQTARYLLSSLSAAAQGQKLSGSVAYLMNVEVAQMNGPCQLSEEDQLDIAFVLDALTWLTVRTMRSLAATLSSRGDADASTTWNEHQVRLIKLAELHVLRYMLAEYADALAEAATSEFSDLLPTLRQMGRLWAVHVIHDTLDLFLETGYLVPKQAEIVRRVHVRTCKDARQEAISLVDAWGYPDWIVKAPLGRYDGDVYSAYFNRICSAPDAVGVPHYWEKHIKPLTNPNN